MQRIDATIEILVPDESDVTVMVSTTPADATPSGALWLGVSAPDAPTVAVRASELLTADELAALRSLRTKAARRLARELGAPEDFTPAPATEGT